MARANTAPSAAGRVPPRFVEGERAILGGILIDGDALPRVLELLSADDFSMEAHRIVFSAITELFDRNQPVDWVTLTAMLKDRGQIDAVGGTVFLTDLADAVPSAANILHYANIVRDKALLRRMISASTEVSTRCFEEHTDVGEFLDEAERLVFAVGEARIRSGFLSTREVARRAMETAERLYERKESITGVPSGFRDLDALTAGFQRSDLVIIAGRPSMGKTAFALNVGLSAAIEGRTPVALFSLEMSADQIGQRLLCMRGHVDLRKLRTGFLAKPDWANLTIALGAISEASIWIDDTPAISSLELRAKARRLHRERKIGLVIVDYLQLMRSSRHRGESREAEIAEISRSLKALAKELNVPVIALSQLNRKVEERPNKRPQLADLRESGALEQDADVILFIYRDEVYNKAIENPKKGVAEIIIGKQRNGPIGRIEVAFLDWCSSFVPLSTRDDSPRGEEM